MNTRIAIIVAVLAAGGGAVSAQEPARSPMFREGECSGVLCSTIGGSQAPQNQPRKTLFPEGECGGILCSAIGGAQAPRHAEAPPACGGGLLCDMAPYAMGQPFTNAAAAAPVPIAAPPAAPEPSKAVSRHRKAPRKRSTS